MIDYTSSYDILGNSPLQEWGADLPYIVSDVFGGTRWGDSPKWKKAVDELPSLTTSNIQLDAKAIEVGRIDECDDQVRAELEKQLRFLHPWRKGPFNLFGVEIETEWRSDLKWDRLNGHIAPLKNRIVLDVGCGSGYHCWRMAGQGAKLVVGIDPTMIYIFQFYALQKYIRQPSVMLFPIGIDDMPNDLNQFDTVFSMGLLYHRRAPLDHLLQLHSLLREDGELVLETLVIEGKEGEVLAPNGRYAKMANVWFIPTPATIEYWLKRAGFKNMRCIDVTKTTTEEQRPTDWMGFESLEHFLDPTNSEKTIEGYPAPRRGIFLANK